MSQKRASVALTALAHLLEAGVPLGALGPAERRSLGPLGPALLVAQEGQPLAGAAADALSLAPAHRAVLEAGEAAGHLGGAARAVAEALDAAARAQTQLLVALLYPCLLFGLAGVILPLPRLFHGGGAAAYLAVAAPTALVAIAPLVFVGVVLARLSPDHRVRRTLADGLAATPLVGRAVRSRRVATFCDVLGRMLGGGVSVAVALGPAAAASGDPALIDGADGARRMLEAGGGLAEALAGVVPEDVRAQLAVGERTGRLDGALAAAARLHHDRAARATTTALAVAGLLAFLAVAGMAAWGIVQTAETAMQPLQDLDRELGD